MLVQVEQSLRDAVDDAPPLLPVQQWPPLLVEDEAVEAPVGHVLVCEQLLFLLDAASDEANQVGVLQLGDQLDLVLELLQPLPGVRRQSLHRDLGAVRQLPLQPNRSESAMAAYLSSIIERPGMIATLARLVDGAESASAEQVVVGEAARRGRQLGEVVQRELGAALLDPPQLQRVLCRGAVPGLRLQLQLPLLLCIGVFFIFFFCQLVMQFSIQDEDFVPPNTTICQWSAGVSLPALFRRALIISRPAAIIAESTVIDTTRATIKTTLWLLSTSFTIKMNSIVNDHAFSFLCSK